MWIDSRDWLDKPSSVETNLKPEEDNAKSTGAAESKNLGETKVNSLKTQEERNQENTDAATYDFLKTSNAENASDTLRKAAIQSANESYGELMQSPSWQDNTIDQAAKDGITAKYKDLIEGPNGFDAKMQGILEKYADQPGKSKERQEELFQAQKQFSKDLGQVANEANGIINGTPASKNAADAKQQAKEQKIAEKEQLRFAQSMKEMIKQSQERELAEQKSKAKDRESEEWARRTEEQKGADGRLTIEFHGMNV